MSLIESIVLGVVQGLTEFLPVSSSGHLAVIKHFLCLSKVPVLFDVILHVATLIVILTFFRNRIRDIIVSFWRMIAGKRDDKDKENLWLLILIVFSTFITALVGLFLANYEELLAGKIFFVAGMFVVTAIILLATRIKTAENIALSKKTGKAERKKLKGYKGMSIAHSLIIGLAQGLGVLPGISRSGITISTALYLDMEWEKAAEYSFLISIPAVLGAVILELKDVSKLFNMMKVTTIVAGFIAALITGYFALIFLVRLVKKGRIHVFGYYLIPLGIIIFVISLFIR